MSKYIGFIGLGAMGFHMACNISKHYPVCVYDVDASRSEQIPNAKVAGDVAEVAQNAEKIFLSLPKTEIVKAVILGKDGLADHLQPGSLIIDTSTTAPQASIAIATELANKHIDFMDAPVSGGPQGAEAANLAIMVGGKQMVFDQNLDLLNCMGSSVKRMGEVGAGGITKLVNNMIVGAAFSSIAEGFALGIQLGLDPAQLYEAIKGGWAGSPVLDVIAPNIAINNYDTANTINLAAKDLGYACALAGENSIEVPVATTVNRLLQEALQQGLGEKGQQAMIKLWL